MHTILDELAKATKVFLETSLCINEKREWESLVLSNLTFLQRRIAEEKNFNSLADLDLAGLLRVLDQNWRLINEQQRLPYEARNWLKEAQIIRNRWAHQPIGGAKPEDQYRDLDTVLRLMVALNAEDSQVQKIREAREKVFSERTQTTERQLVSELESPSTKYAKGSIVRLKANPEITGAIIDISTKSAEVRYTVFHDGTTSNYYDSQLEPINEKASIRNVSIEVLNASLSAIQLLHPNTTNLYSLFSSRINFVPYQFRPVLKLIQSDRPRLLIADEVGVGKTIEAGLILKELQARQDIRSVLIICPKPLVSEKKWLTEMKRFDEQFTELDGPSLRYCIQESNLDGSWPQQYSRAIVPYSLFDEALLLGKTKGGRKELGLLDLDPPPHFDLIIVDEAHHIRNTDTWAYRTVRFFCDNSEAAVLLSATPIQLGNEDLFTLLQLLRPDVITSKYDFAQMSEPNPHINTAIEFARAAMSKWQTKAREELKKAVANNWGKTVLLSDRRMQHAYDLLESEESNSEDRLKFISQLESLYTFSNFINRTRRRDIGNFTTRKPLTVEVHFTPEQSRLHDSLLKLQEKLYRRYKANQNLGFILSTLRRQLASCVFGLAPLLESILEKRFSPLELGEVEDIDIEKDFSEMLAEFRQDINDLLEIAHKVHGPDPKFKEFEKIVFEKQSLANNKLLVFTSFRHTLSYLDKNLRDKSIRIGVIHGDIKDDERRAIRNRFSLGKEDPQALDVLLSSEVGCEGLDYQFCDAMVNYDIPWNPMRIEQRIGRIDRYGQRSETVVIYNFVTPGTIDADIYQRCLERIGVFRQALGGSEEILGRFTQEIKSITENFNLSPQEQVVRLQQLSDNQIRLVLEEEKLEEHQKQLFGLTIPKQDVEMIQSASSYWLAPARLANLVQIYLAKLGVVESKSSLGTKPVSTLQIRQEIRNRLLLDFYNLKTNGAQAVAWERWLKGSEPYLSLTFDQATAQDRRDLTFINPTHPLVKQAAHSLEPEETLSCDLTVDSDQVAPGRYSYAVYRWIKHGLKEEIAFKPICEDDAVHQVLLDLLRSSRSHDRESVITGDEEERLERIQHGLWRNARAEHIAEIHEISKVKLASLTATQNARLGLLQEQRDHAEDIRIRRMRDAQIESAINDYEKQKQLLERVAERGDIASQLVAIGIINVQQSS